MFHEMMEGAFTGFAILAMINAAVVLWEDDKSHRPAEKERQIRDLEEWRARQVVK